MKRQIRNLIAEGAAWTGLSDPQRVHRDCLAIATFHRVLPESLRLQYPIPGLVVTPSELRQCLRYFVQHYDVGPLAQQWQAWRSRKVSSKPLLALTFDDAEHDNLEYAVPVLREFALRASFYAPIEQNIRQVALWHDRAGFALLHLAKQARPLDDVVRTDVGNQIEALKDLTPEAREQAVVRLEEQTEVTLPSWARLLTVAELRRLADMGHEIGSHSLTHPLLPQLPQRELEHELRASRQQLQELVGRDVTTFCYPNGSAGLREALAAEEAGYSCAVTTRWGTNNRAADRFRLRRFDINPFHVRRGAELDLSALAWRMSGLQPGL